MYGDALLVAPVLERDAVERTVYLPAGSTWRNVWTGQTSTGGKSLVVNVEKYGAIPCFLRDEMTANLCSFLELTKFGEKYEIKSNSFN